MPGFWGCDSLRLISTPTAGYVSTAWYVIDVQYAGNPHDQIVWWGRYFDYGKNQNDHWQGDGEAYSLTQAVEGYANPTSNQAWILPIASPETLNGTQANGTYDANYVGGIIAHSVGGRVRIPGNLECFVYLDIEKGEATSQAFLLGWGIGINMYDIGGVAPLYAGVYMNPPDPTNVANVEAVGWYIEAWTVQPQGQCSTGGCDSPGPSWAAQAVGDVPTDVWQYAVTSSCGCRNQTLYVDLDYTNPSVHGSYGYGMCDNMLYLPPSG